MSIANKKPSIVYWLGDKLYLNVTNRCSNNCYFCFRRYKRGIDRFNLELTKEPTQSQIIAELRSFLNRRLWKEIVFCGFGEPLERLDCVLEVTRWIKKHSQIAVRIDTNGQVNLLKKEKNVIDELREAGVDRISISLNAHDKETYNDVCRPKFENAYESILDFVENAKDHFDIEITAVNIPELNISATKEIAEKMGVQFRLREYHRCFW
ncbi:MAG: TatD family nuclease-associated radical SAM protein [Candidatus Bathyarchaeota archaeon]|jgi:TatD family-associated radical SAM protein